MSRANREIRISQTIVPFGVGAIYTIFGESFVACDTALWPKGMNMRRVRAEALRRSLGVEELLSPLSADVKKAGLPYMRFPEWMFCQNKRCKRLIKWNRDEEKIGEPATCFSCGSNKPLAPMRFILVCKNGHFADVPWHRWAHVGKAFCDKPKDLKYEGVRDAGSGLASLIVRCNTCKASRSLSGITLTDSMRALGVVCTGKHPWQGAARVEACAEPMRVVQRGASNVYFAVLRSALDIPQANGAIEDDENVAVRNHPDFEPLLRHWKKTGHRGAMVDPCLDSIETDTGISRPQIVAIVQRELTEAPAQGESDIAVTEWLALREEHDEEGYKSPLITRRTPLMWPGAGDIVQQIADRIKDIMLVTRLKEARALVGFSRLEPDARMLRTDLTSAGSARLVQWVPTIEVFGEGVFLEFNESLVREWEQRKPVIARSEKMIDRLEGSTLASAILKQRLPWQHIDARFIMLHSFAHLIMRELCYETGYSSAALSERVYARPSSDPVPQAGILIYTAAGDSEGTLGGLVRQGQAPRLMSSILKALESAIWCSADPLCRESDGQGYDRTNLAACHACSLLPETSCISGNMLLDRSLVVGPQGEEDLGYFPDPTCSLGDV